VDLVGDVVERACLRAGLPRVGPYCLRHALAAELLSHGVDWLRSVRCFGITTWQPLPLRQGRPDYAAAGSRRAVAGRAG
jgi:hypothetical protein